MDNNSKIIQSSLFRITIGTAVALLIAAVVVRYWIATPDLSNDYSLKLFGLSHIVDPLNLAAKYFIISGIFLLSAVILLSIKNKVLFAEAKRNFRLSLKTVVLYCLCITFFSIAVESSSTVWTYIMKSSRTGDTNGKYTKVYKKGNYSFTFSFVPKKKMAQMFAIMSHTTTHAGAAARKSFNELKKRNTLANIFWVITVLFIFVTLILARSDLKRITPNQSGNKGL